ncbi:serine O-acetyltransferase [Arcticibacter pallidicorallinus]|uniref:Serine acetyltransferase n=1 Tax=Arcticibacter pallidicorallinus TaxID=1259464 RepID=A0A2T0UBM0_9SPHI|nr:DapH/DapD/GlmU-related protein [Arcticibacter pallidicorallinus]PRY55292.1 serine O-acetyltransferase [Arcticibacter pallidicorallinus]
MSFSKLIDGIQQDFKGYSEYSKSSVKVFFKLHFYCNVLFRLSSFFYRLKLLPVARIFWLLNRVVFSIDIDPGAQLRGGMVIIHGIGVVIGRHVVSIGSFRIYQGATLGGNNGKTANTIFGDISQPIIGNNVVIGINSVVIGPVIIGDRAVIGANAVVTRDVQENEKIVGSNRVLK